jgi:hypothetical protein
MGERIDGTLDRYDHVGVQGSVRGCVVHPDRSLEGHDALVEEVLDLHVPPAILVDHGEVHDVAEVGVDEVGDGLVVARPVTRQQRLDLVGIEHRVLPRQVQEPVQVLVEVGDELKGHGKSLLHRIDCRTFGFRHGGAPRSAPRRETSIPNGTRHALQ